MNIPEFKPSRNYFNELKLACLVAKVPNRSSRDRMVRISTLVRVGAMFEQGEALSKRIIDSSRSR
jgi:hypothetical protein